MRALFLPCRWLPSCYVLTWPFPHCVLPAEWGVKEAEGWSSEDINPIWLGAHPYDLILTLINLGGPSPNTAMLRIGAPTYGFLREHIQSMIDTFPLLMRVQCGNLLQLDWLGPNPSCATSKLHGHGKVNLSFFIWKIRIITLSNMVLTMCQVLVHICITSFNPHFNPVRWDLIPILEMRKLKFSDLPKSQR